MAKRRNEKNKIKEGRSKSDKWCNKHDCKKRQYRERYICPKCDFEEYPKQVKIALEETNVVEPNEEICNT